jgi:hypothetical protein
MLSQFNYSRWPRRDLSSISPTYLWATFTPVAPKSIIIQSSYQYLFTLLGSMGAKALCRMLMKLTPTLWKTNLLIRKKSTFFPDKSNYKYKYIYLFIYIHINTIHSRVTTCCSNTSGHTWTFISGPKFVFAPSSAASPWQSYEGYAELVR